MVVGEKNEPFQISFKGLLAARCLSFALRIIASGGVWLLIAGVGSAQMPRALESSTSCSGNELTFVNNNSYPIWLGEAVQAGSLIPSPNTANDWEIGASSSIQMCMPAGWSGNFWARTGCQFAALYASDPNYKTCSSDSDCSGGDVCWGGQCVLTGCSTNQDCINSLGGNQNAQCQVQPLNGTPTHFCVIPKACQTGDCNGSSQCYGTWDGVTSNAGGAPPVSLFEPTSNSASNVNYDVSLVSGYNTAISVVPSTKASGANCYAPKCVTDLNSVCPANLQVLATPMSSPPTSIKCGNGYCASGVCQSNMCVIGCEQPGIQCTTASPNPNLMCTTAVASPSPTPSPSWTPDGSTYQDMYSAKNVSGNVNPTTGDSMASGLQGTALCWGHLECPSGQTCQLGVLPAEYPASIGICSNQAPATNCSTPTDIGNECGNYYTDGFQNSLGYSCVGVTGGGVACLPPTTAGLGAGPYSATGQADLFAGAGGLSNPEWMAAAMQAGDGTEPYFETFSEACPREYAWQYDDYAGGLDCNSGGQTVNFTISFGLPSSELQTPAKLGAFPSVLSFGRVAGGTSSKSRTLRLRNTSKWDAVVEQLVSPADFTISNDTCSHNTVSRGKFCTVSISFAPAAAAGPERARLNVPYNGVSPRITLTGRSVAP